VLLVIASDGTLYANDGATWFTPYEVLNEDLDADRVTCLSTLTLSSGDRVVLVGTNHGYLEVAYGSGTFDETAFSASTTAIPGAASVTTSGTDYSVVDLRRSVVLNFRIANSRLFVGTAGMGLWRISYDSETRKWDRE
jgi:hypothetical protein